MPPKVLSLALPRTGTASMRLALSTLGYTPTMHAYEIVDHPLKADAWLPLIKAKWEGQGPVTKEMCDAAVGSYEALTDVPAAAFWEELIAFYPEAKVILVEREYDPWAKSFQLVIDNILGLPGNITRYAIEPLSGHHVLYMLQTLYLHQFRAASGAEVMANARQVYEEHYAGVRRAVPAERLLEFKLGEGWGPLCKFLGREVPGGEFPWINDAEDFQKKVDETMGLWARQVARKAVWPAVLGVGGGLAWWFYG